MINNRIPPASLVRDALKKSDKFSITALGSSMTPVIWHRSIVTVRWSDPGEIKAGDIIVKGIGFNYIIHRVIGIRENMHENGEKYLHFITKGDFLAKPDPFYCADEYIGKVCRIENRFISFDPNSLSGLIRGLCVFFSKAGCLADRAFGFLYKFIYKNRILQLIYRTVFSFPVLVINTGVLIYYYLRRRLWKNSRESWGAY